MGQGSNSLGCLKNACRVAGLHETWYGTVNNFDRFINMLATNYLIQLTPCMLLSSLELLIALTGI